MLGQRGNGPHLLLLKLLFAVMHLHAGCHAF
jgi:hypothetical protein